jgi:hypothetical protein
MGRCALAAGRTADAEADLREAREIFQRIGAAEANEVLSREPQVSLDRVGPVRVVESGLRFLPSIRGRKQAGRR